MGGSTLHYIFVIQNISIILIILSELFLLQRISFHPGIDQYCNSKFAKNPRLNFRFIWKRGLWRRAQRVLVVTVLDAISGRQTCPTVIPFLWPRAWYEFTKCTHAKCPFVKIGRQFVSCIYKKIILDEKMASAADVGKLQMLCRVQASSSSPPLNDSFSARVY